MLTNEGINKGIKSLLRLNQLKEMKLLLYIYRGRIYNSLNLYFFYTIYKLLDLNTSTVEVVFHIYV